MTVQTSVILSILLPLFASVVIALLDRKPNVREGVTIVTSVLTFLLVLGVYFAVKSGPVENILIFEPFVGVSISLKPEPLGMLFALMASFLWIVTSIYSIGYMRGHHEINQTRFYAFFAIAISSTLGIAFSGNGFTLFLFYEALTFSTFPLVTHKGDEKSKRSGRVYLFILVGTSIAFLLFALITTWQLTGTLDFQPGGILSDEYSKTLLSLLLILYVFGVGKAALMPFHRWLPAAMVAPTPVSALLHAVAVVKAGVFTVLKIMVYIFGLDLLGELFVHHILAYVAAFTVIATAIIALRVDNLKRRLAYSTIGQLSYIVLGALVANAWGIIGGGMHMLMHGFGKITLFFGAGAIMVATHKVNVSELRGIGRRMPVTMTAFFIGCVATIGAPPTGGMWSKWYLLLGAANAHDFVLMGAIVLGSILSAAYLLPIAIYAFFPEENSNPARTEAPVPIQIAMVISSAGCLILFFMPDFAFQLMDSIVQAGLK